MSGDEIAPLVVRMERLEQRMSALEAARVADMSSVRDVVVTILDEEMPRLIRDGVLEVIRNERLVADAQRFQALLSLGRRLALAALLAGITGLVAIALNAWVVH
jgi:hypothetical protein